MYVGIALKFLASAIASANGRPRSAAATRVRRRTQLPNEELQRDADVDEELKSEPRCDARCAR